MKETLDRWLYGKDVLDILRIAGDDLSVEEFLGLLKTASAPGVFDLLERTGAS